MANAANTNAQTATQQAAAALVQGNTQQAAAPVAKAKRAPKQAAAPVVVGAPVNFRVVVRGNVGGVRVRKVQNVPATCVATAYMLGTALAEKIIAAHALGNPFFNIYPPVGEKCNGTPSKGYAIVNGMVVKQTVTA